MSSIVEICNLAISRINARRIQSLSDSSKEARACTLHYNIAKDAVLADHDWSFARKRITMALLTDTYSGWTYAYAYPSDCIAPRHIYDGVAGVTGTSYDFDEDRFDVTDRVNYEIATADSLTSRVILTEQASAEMRYTARVSDPNMFPPVFISALGYKLAAELGPAVKSSPQTMSNMLTMYDGVVARAKAVDGNSDYNKKKINSSFYKARG